MALSTRAPIACVRRSRPRRLVWARIVVRWPVVVLVDAVLAGRGGGIDHRKGCLHLVGGILRPVPVVGHACAMSEALWMQLGTFVTG